MFRAQTAGLLAYIRARAFGYMSAGQGSAVTLSTSAVVVAALGQPQHPEERALFLKLDAWHTLELPLLQRAFPGVPWVFLYRACSKRH